MDSSLFRRAVELHGGELGRLIKEEQGPAFLRDGAAAEQLSGAPSGQKATPPKVDSKLKKSTASSSRRDDRKSSTDKSVSGEFTRRLHSFIARKADLLFAEAATDEGGAEGAAPGVGVAAPPAQSPQEAGAGGGGDQELAEKSDYYAILPPLEQFAQVPPDVCRERLFDVLSAGGLVAGQVVSAKPFGVFVRLLALCRSGGDVDPPPRFLEDCEAVALLPAAELRDKFAAAAAVDDFRVGDFVRAAVTKVTAEEQKVIISLHARDGQDQSQLGLISESELPVHYRRSLAQLDSLETYQEMLHNTVGFDNPFNVAYLGGRLGLKDSRPHSLMRGLQRRNFPEKEFAEPLRKWQTNKWSMESVAKGVECFKAGRLLDAMHHLNKALEIHEENVEALVARGALYANKDLLSKALQDFSKALKINPNHRNANKYMCQTLVERGKQQEEGGEMEKAAECYQTALDIKPDFSEAELCLSKLNKRRTPARRRDSPETISSSSPRSAGVETMSVEALRQLVQPAGASGSAQKPKKQKKKKKKEKEEKKKDQRRSSRLEEDIEEEEEEEEERKRQGQSSQRKSQRKKRNHSRQYSPISDGSSSVDDSRSRSRSKSPHQRGYKVSGEKRRSGRSSSRKRADGQGRRRRSRYSDSESSLSSNYGSRSPPSSASGSRSRSRHGGRRRSQQQQQQRRHRGNRSASHSGNGSSRSSRSRSRHHHRHTSGSTRRSSQASSSKGGARRSRGSTSRSSSRSPRSGTASSYSSVSPRADARSLDRFRRRKRSREEGSRERSSRPETKAGRRGSRSSPPSPPGPRRRKLSEEYPEAVAGGRTGSGKGQLSADAREERVGSRSKPALDESFRQRSRAKIAAEEVQVYPGSAGLKGSSVKREADAFQSTEAGLSKSRKKRSITEEGLTDRITSEPSKQTTVPWSDLKSRQSSARGKNPTDAASIRKDQGSEDEDIRDGRRSGRAGQRSPASPSESSPEGSDSDRSYSSHSSSGSRSHSSYSSYSSSGSCSDSGEASAHQQGQRGDRGLHRSRTSSGPSRGHAGDSGESDSDVDTGIYEISRDHLEMYMESKSYQRGKTGADAPAPGAKKKWPSGEEGGEAEGKRSRSERKRKRGNSDEAGRDEAPSVAGSRPGNETQPAEASSQRDGSRSVPTSSRPSNPSSLPPGSQPTRSGDIGTSAVASPPRVQFSESPLGSHQPLVSGSRASATTYPHQQPRQSPPASRRAPSRPPEHGVSLPSSVPNGKNDRHKPSESVDGRVPAAHHRESILNRGGGAVGVSRAEPRLESSHPRMFTSEQLTVIDSISIQLAHAQELVVPSDPGLEATVGEPGYQTDSSAAAMGQWSSEAASGSHGPHVGTMLEPSAGYHNVAMTQTLGQADRFDVGHPERQRRRWDAQRPGGQATGRRGENDQPPDVMKPLPMSFDYQHGRDMSAAEYQAIEGKLRELRQGAAGLRDPSAPPGDVCLDDHRGWRGRLDPGGQHFGRQEPVHDGRGEWPLEGGRQAGPNPDPHGYYRQDQSGSGRMEAASGSAPPHVVDYRHGRREEAAERHDERRSSRQQDDQAEGRRHGDQRRPSHHRHGERRRRSPPEQDSSRRGRSYDDRDCGDGSSSSRHRRDSGSSGRHRRDDGRRAGRSPVRSRESNRFLQLVSSGKDLQVALLHSEGKWGREDSPVQAKPSSRSWWL